MPVADAMPIRMVRGRDRVENGAFGGDLNQKTAGFT